MSASPDRVFHCTVLIICYDGLGKKNTTKQENPDPVGNNEDVVGRPGPPAPTILPAEARGTAPSCPCDRPRGVDY